MRSRIESMKKVASTLRSHRELILNYFRAKKQFSGGVVPGLNNKAKLTMRKAYALPKAPCIMHLPNYQSQTPPIDSTPFPRLRWEREVRLWRTADVAPVTFARNLRRTSGGPWYDRVR
jgi:hypothetical protein